VDHRAGRGMDQAFFEVHPVQSLALPSAYHQHLEVLDVSAGQLLLEEAFPFLQPSFGEKVRSNPGVGTGLVDIQDTGLDLEDPQAHQDCCFSDPHMVRNQARVHIRA